MPFKDRREQATAFAHMSLAWVKAKAISRREMAKAMRVEPLAILCIFI